MSGRLRVLVTAVGGDLGQAIVKALRLSGDVACHGCDSDATGVGPVFVESFHTVPRAGSDEYLPILGGLCREHGFDAVIPASEAEIALLAGLGAPPMLGATPIVCQGGDWLRTYSDKLTCMRALQGRVELAPFADGEDHGDVERLVASAGFPLVVKPRRSSGSRSIRTVRREDDLAAALAAIPHPVVQAHIDESGGEYTVGLFSCPAFSTALAFRRALGSVGCSWYAESSDDAEVLAYARVVAAASGLRGSANVQVRRSMAGVRLLEVNARFSSLVAARAAAGFHDAYWSLLLGVGETPQEPREPYRRVRFRRFFHEVLDFGDGYHALAPWQPRIGEGGSD